MLLELEQIFLDQFVVDDFTQQPIKCCTLAAHREVRLLKQKRLNKLPEMLTTARNISVETKKRVERQHHRREKKNERKKQSSRT